jgi:DNA-binding SARP family transcriptional activator
LIETLSPEQDLRKTSNRLSVTLSTVRAVFDPPRQFDAHHFIRSDRYAVRLERDDLSIDVEEFLEDAQAGLALRRGGGDDAAELLEQAEAAYAGDFLEEDLYEDWATLLREEARAAYVAVASALAELARRDADPAKAIRFRLRILGRDPYDEGAHLDLVASLATLGHHGSARRAYDCYVERMREIGVAPAPCRQRGMRRWRSAGTPSSRRELWAPALRPL